MQPQASNLKTHQRSIRSTTSCIECRRRKQKCDQLQPCSNCKRRFPEPVCEYGPRNKQTKEIAGLPRTLFPTFSVNLNEQDAAGSKGRKSHALPDSSARGQAAKDRQRKPLVVRWSGVGICTAYPGDQEDGDDDDYDDGKDPGDTMPWETVLDWSQVDSSAREMSLDRGQAASGSWKLALARAGARFQRKQDLWRFAGPTDGLPPLPMDPTKENVMLNSGFAELLYRFKGSFDGYPDPDNPFVREYVPWCLHSNLLAITSRYVAARSLAERDHVSKKVAFELNGQAIRKLNQCLATEKRPSEETVAGVVQFVSIEFYFGAPEVVECHLQGLRQVIQLRRGFSQRGVGALVSKVALVDDAVIALAFEKPPVLRKGDGFEYEYNEPPNDHFQLQFNTPFLDNSLAFADFARALDIHPTTALILDDMRFLLNKVAALGPDSSPQAVQKLQSTADWIYKSIIALPLELTEPRAEPRSVGQYPLDCYPSPEDSDMGDPTAGTEHLKPHSLLPDRPSLTRQTSNSPEPRLSPSESQPPLSPTSTDQKSSAPSVPDSDRSPSDPPPAAVDPLYGAVRLAAPIYARAIATRQPLSAVCSTKEAMQLLIATWKIPLARWRGVIGIFIFILTAIIPATTSSTSPFVMPHNGFVKSILQIGYMQMAINNWGVAAEAMQRSLGLQSWLRGAIAPAEKASGNKAGERSKEGDQATKQEEVGKQAAGAALGVELRTDSSSFSEDFASDGGGHEDADADRTKGCYAEHIQRYTTDV